MKKKLYNTGILVGMMVLIFCGTSGQDGRGTYYAHVILDNILKSDRAYDKLFGIVTIETDAMKAKISEARAMEEKRKAEKLKEEKLNPYYGSWRIAEFYPTASFDGWETDAFSRQEADMMLGRIIDIKPERLLTYDIEGRKTIWRKSGFENNHIERYVMEKPEYEWEPIDGAKLESPSTMAEMRLRKLGKERLKQINGVISTPQTFVVQRFYTLADKDRLILESDLNYQYFLLERCEEEAEEPHPELSSEESREVLQEIYGAYRVAEFLPTKFFPVKDYDGRIRLLEEEADLVIGRTVTITENLFVTYDNYRQASPLIDRRREHGSWVAEAEIISPDYRIKRVWADEIYGIRDGMLPKDLARQEYVEIDVYPGIGRPGYYGRQLPQMLKQGQERSVITMALTG